MRLPAVMDARIVGAGDFGVRGLHEIAERFVWRGSTVEVLQRGRKDRKPLLGVAQVEVPGQHQRDRGIAFAAKEFAQEIHLFAIGAGAFPGGGHGGAPAVEMGRRHLHPALARHLKRDENHALGGKAIEPRAGAFRKGRGLDVDDRIIAQHQQSAVELRPAVEPAKRKAPRTRLGRAGNARAGRLIAITRLVADGLGARDECLLQDHHGRLHPALAHVGQMRRDIRQRLGTPPRDGPRQALHIIGHDREVGRFKLWKRHFQRGERRCRLSSGGPCHKQCPRHAERDSRFTTRPVHQSPVKARRQSQA